MDKTPKPGLVDRVVNTVGKKVGKKLRSAEERARDSENKRTRAGLYLWRLCVQLLRQWKKDQCPQTAAGLSYQTILSLVPILAVILAAFRATGAMGAESSLVDFLAREFILLSREEISAKLLEWSGKIDFETMGIAGIVSVMLIAFYTFNGLERSVNRIWRVEKRRSLRKRMATFYVTATLGPLLFGFSLYQASQFGLSEGLPGAALSALMAFCGLFLVNYILPATPVLVRAALIGAFVNTIAAELAKAGFSYYVTQVAMERYAGVYGTLAVIPICLIWIYWSWLMLLLGVEVTHAVQNYHILEKTHHGQVLSLADEFETRVNAMTAIDITVAIAQSQKRTNAGLSKFQIAQAFALSDDAVRVVLRRLVEAKILALPNTAKPVWSLQPLPEECTVLRIFDAFDECSALLAQDNKEQRPTLAKLIATNRANADALTIADLLEAEEEA